eukprot:8474808-Ditylum_brightwellii.AAC.1
MPTKRTFNEDAQCIVRTDGGGGDGKTDTSLTNTLMLLKIERCFHPLLSELCAQSKRPDPLVDLEPSDIYGRIDADGKKVPMPVARGLVRKIHRKHTVLPAVDEVRKRIEEERNKAAQHHIITSERSAVDENEKAIKLLTLQNVVVPRQDNSSYGLKLAPTSVNRRAFIFSIENSALCSDPGVDGVTKLRRGDVLVKVNGMDTLNATFEEVIGKVRNIPEGENLVIDVCRKAEEEGIVEKPIAETKEDENDDGPKYYSTSSSDSSSDSESRKRRR